MILDKAYFFCGVGGSGMMPLALIVQARGGRVAGSDRALDQGRTAPKFDFLRAHGIGLFPQDGSGLTDKGQVLVHSTAVEETVPDRVAARKLGCKTLTRAKLLSALFNEAPTSVGVAGTSGKSTVTGMIGWILHQAGKDPTVVNGAVMKNFAAPDAPFASALVGDADLFVAEVDESDGSIAAYSPDVAVVNNIALDHKSMDELRALFADFTAKARVAVLNLDNAETAALVTDKAVTFSLRDGTADYLAEDVVQEAWGVAFTVHHGDERAEVRLKTPGLHNVSNALAAIAATAALGVSLKAAAVALGAFAGIRRRLEVVGEAGGVTVIDDFAHNPDKIAATLDTLHAAPGRLLVMFQPHGFGPLRLMKDAFIEVFAQRLAADDILLMPEPVYYGGTTDRSVSSADITSGVTAWGRAAHALADRATCGERLLELARPGDRIVVMGARDDTLTTFAEGLLERLAGR